MRWLKTVCTIAGLNLRKWKSDCRVWVAFLLVLILIHSTTKQLGDIVAHTGVKSSPWISRSCTCPTTTSCCSSSR